MPSPAGLEITQETRFERLLRWYTNSGIPVAVDVFAGPEDPEGHALVCNGYGDDRAVDFAGIGSYIREEDKGNSTFDSVLDKSWRVVDSAGVSSRECVLIDEADIPRRFSVIDDGQMPYSLRSYERLSEYRSMRCKHYIVPLHRGMFLDAMDAYDHFISLITHSKLQRSAHASIRRICVCAFDGHTRLGG